MPAACIRDSQRSASSSTSPGGWNDATRCTRRRTSSAHTRAAPSLPSAGRSPGSGQDARDSRARSGSTRPSDSNTTRVTKHGICRNACRRVSNIPDRSSAPCIDQHFRYAFTSRTAWRNLPCRSPSITAFPATWSSLTRVSTFAVVGHERSIHVTMSASSPPDPEARATLAANTIPTAKVHATARAGIGRSIQS